jgi:hypothetical protein
MGNFRQKKRPYYNLLHVLKVVHEQHYAPHPLVYFDHLIVLASRPQHNYEVTEEQPCAPQYVQGIAHLIVRPYWRWRVRLRLEYQQDDPIRSIEQGFLAHLASSQNFPSSTNGDVQTILEKIFQASTCASKWLGC